MKKQNKCSKSNKYILLFIMTILAIVIILVIFNKRQKQEAFADKVKFIYLYSNSCGHCKQFTPTLKQFVEETHANFEMYERSDPQAAKYINHVSGFPSILAVNDVNHVQDVLVGNVPKDTLASFVKKNASI